MKLASKFVAIIIGVFLMLIALDCWWLVRREIQHFHAEAHREARILGHAMKFLVADVWERQGEARALEVLNDVNRGEQAIHIRWVWLDEPAPADHRPAVPLEDIRDQLAGAATSIHMPGREAGDVSYSYVSAPVPTDREGAIELATPMDTLRSYITRTILRSFLLASVVLLIGSLVVVVLGYSMIGRPLHRITQKIRRIAKGDLNDPLDMRRHDEIAEVARGLNTMCDDLAKARKQAGEEAEARIIALERLRHKDRLETIGTLASGIAHELGTPINVVLGRAGLVRRGSLNADQTAECTQIIRDQCERMTAIIQRLLDFARHKPPAKIEMNVCDSIRTVIELLQPLAQQNDVRLTFADQPANDHAMVSADPGQIEQVLTNLAMNAVQASRETKGTVEFAVQTAAPDKGGDDHRAGTTPWVRIDVSDSGKGIRPHEQKHVFEPFFSTKAAGEGTGLGLAIVKEIVEEHGGNIEFASQLGEGTRFSVFLPMETSDDDHE